MIPLYFSMYNCNLYIRFPSHSVHKRPLTPARLSVNVLSCLLSPCLLSPCLLSPRLLSPCPLSPCLLSPCLLSPCLLSHVQYVPSKLCLHLLLPVWFLPGFNSIVMAVIRIGTRYGNYLPFMICAVSCRMLSTQRSGGQQQNYTYCETQLFLNRQA